MAEVGNIVVQFVDGSSETVRVSPRVQVAVERHFDMSIADVARAEHLYYAAYMGLKITDRAQGTFDDFLDRVADVDLQDVKPVDPTLPAQPTDEPSS